MKSVYCDNASTSWPKPPGVGEAMAGYVDNIGCNIGRATYRRAHSSARLVYDTREQLRRLFGAPPECDNAHVVFTANVTQSLNTVLKGLLGPGDHVLVTGLAHNAVTRPLKAMEAQGVTWDVIPCDERGILDLDAMVDLVKPATKAVVLTHGCNVCGRILPLAEVGAFCHKKGLVYIVDAAQTAGVRNIDMTDAHIDALCFTGHKGLGGPQGTGGFVLTDELVRRIRPLIEGGTGSVSEQLAMPDFLPDKFEAGTMNLPGIAGLNAALTYLESVGVSYVALLERRLTNAFLKGAASIPGIHVVGGAEPCDRGPVVSITCDGVDLSEFATDLDRRFGIMTRVGLHCAPLSHQTLGTWPGGSLRFSFNHFNTLEEVNVVLDALDTMMREGR